MKRIVISAWRLMATLRRPSKNSNRRHLQLQGESVDSFKIREATPADVPELARLHVKMWNWTYAPFLEVGPSYDVRERQWHAGFAKADPSWFCFVVERPDGEIVGFAQGNKSDNPDFAGQLNKIYILPEYQRLGLGRRLVGHVAKRFISEDINTMWLFADARNPSIRAWLALGAKKIDDNPANGNYGWHDLRSLLAVVNKCV